MGESTCLMQTPFSHTSEATPFHEPQEENPLHALGDSVSFGRFMTEPLAWGKWSSFNHNQYLEEVEKYSKPGSVAQKKAYFEEHYKKKKKAAAVAALEEEQLAAINAVEPDCNSGFCNAVTLDTELVGSNCRANIDEPVKAKMEAVVWTSEADLSIDVEKCDYNGETGGPEIVEIEQFNACQVMPSKSPNQQDVEDRMTKEVERDITMPSEMMPLKEISSANQESTALTMKIKPSASSSKALVHHRASKLPFSPSPARPRTPGNMRKENNPTLTSKKTPKDLTDSRRPAASSLHMSLNFAPSHAGETNKIATTVHEKARGSTIPIGLARTPKDCSTCLKTLTRASRTVVPKFPLMNPYPESRRTGAPVEQTVLESRKMDVKWKSVSIEHPKSSSAFDNKSCSPFASSSFSLRCEERAAKRKEYFQKLEEEHNAKEAQKLELQAKSKEKAETEFRKLRQNLGFKAKPMPDFYHETQLPKTQLKKIPLTRPRSPKLGRKPNNASALHETSSLPPAMSSGKSDGLKQGTKKTSRPPSRSSTPTKNAHENDSPNIQS